MKKSTFTPKNLWHSPVARAGPLTVNGAVGIIAGNAAGSTGSFTQEGGSISVSTGSLYIGRNTNGQGTYTMNDGTLTLSGASSHLILGNNPGSSGEFVLDGGTVRVSSTIGLLVGNAPGATAEFTQTGGTIIVQGGDPSNFWLGCDGAGTGLVGAAGARPGVTVIGDDTDGHCALSACFLNMASYLVLFRRDNRWLYERFWNRDIGAW